MAARSAFSNAAIVFSGASAELEEMRGLAMLLKQGWKPKRTIV